MYFCATLFVFLFRPPPAQRFLSPPKSPLIGIAFWRYFSRWLTFLFFPPLNPQSILTLDCVIHSPLPLNLPGVRCPLFLFSWVCCWLCVCFGFTLPPPSLFPESAGVQDFPRVSVAPPCLSPIGGPYTQMTCCCLHLRFRAVGIFFYVGSRRPFSFRLGIPPLLRVIIIDIS